MRSEAKGLNAWVVGRRRQTTMRLISQELTFGWKRTRTHARAASPPDALARWRELWLRALRARSLGNCTFHRPSDAYYAIVAVVLGLIVQRRRTKLRCCPEREAGSGRASFSRRSWLSARRRKQKQHPA